jgi:hypothetical protein
MLQFPYQDEPVPTPPLPSLPPSTTLRWRPLIPVTLIGPTGKRRFFSRALLDPGADDTIFPLALAAVLDVRLRIDAGHAIRWRGQAHPLRFGDVQLELSDGTDVWSWPAIVGFSSASIRCPILGLAGCLQFFDARFRGQDTLVELETNPSFLGIITP